MSALLHSLVNMTSKKFQVSPELPSSVLVDGDSEQAMPVTSVLSWWNVPRVRKVSNLQLSDAIFEKHDYQKPVEKTDQGF